MINRRLSWSLMVVGTIVWGSTGVTGLVPPASADVGDPSSVTATAEGLNLKVAWDGALGGDVTNYQVTTQPESPAVVVESTVRSAVLTGVRPNVDYSVTVSAVHADGSVTDVDAPNTVHLAAPGGSFNALPPLRLLDTRNGTGAQRGPTTGVSLLVAGRGGIPDSDVSAVALNVTVTAPQNRGFITVFPSGVGQPQVSNVNYVTGQTVANLVIVPVGKDGRIQLFSSAKVQLIADVAGYFTTAAAASPSEGLFSPVQPVRLMDTRTGFGASTPGPGEQVKLKVTGAGGIPADNVSAVVLNTTVTSPTSAGFVTAYPTGTGVPLASTINFAKGQTVANRTIVPVGDDGSISFFNSTGNTPLILDVTGFFSSDQDDSATGSYFAPISPRRLVDTRRGLGVPKGPLTDSAVLAVGVAGGNGIPAASARTPANAAVTTVTYVHPSSVTFGTVYPSLSNRPVASDLNALPGRDVPNLTLPGLGTDGRVAVFNARGNTDVLVDLSGYFIGNVHVPSSSVVVAPAQIAGVQGAAGNPQTVTLTSGSPARKPGEIISAGVSAQTPAGLLVKVVGVGVNGAGQQVLQTEPTTLQDALGSVDLAVNVPFDAADAVPANGGRRPTRVLTAQDLAARQLHPSATPVAQDKKKSLCSGDNTSFVETSFAVTPSLNVEGHIGWSHFHPTVRASTYAQVTEDAFAGFAFGGKVGCSWNKILSEYNFPTVTFAVAGWPVVIIPHLTVTLKAKIDGSAVISSSVTQHFSAKAGLEYDGGKVKPIQELSNTVSYQPLALTEAKGSASVAIEAEVVGQFYGVAGPAVTITATLGATVDVAATPEWQLTFAITAAASLNLKLSIIDVSVSTDEFTLFEKVLAEANGLPSPTTAVNLTFDEYPVGTYITDAYRSFGVEFAGEGESPFLTNDAGDPTSPVLTGGGPNTFGDPLYGSFTNPDGSPRSVDRFVLDVGYINEPGSTEVLAYNSRGTLLATVRATFVGMNTITINQPDIRSFIIRSTGVEDSGWAIDNLKFQGFAGSVDQADVQKVPARSPSSSTTEGSR